MHDTDAQMKKLDEAYERSAERKGTPERHAPEMGEEHGYKSPDFAGAGQAPNDPPCDEGRSG